MLCSLNDFFHLSIAERGHDDVLSCFSEDSICCDGFQSM